MSQTGSGGIGFVSVGIGELAVMVILGVVVIVAIWFVAKMLLAALKG